MSRPPDPPPKPVMTISWHPDIWAPVIAWDKRQRAKEAKAASEAQARQRPTAAE